MRSGPAPGFRHFYRHYRTAVRPVRLIYYFRGGLDPKAALPYLAGGLVGGLVGGKVFKKLSMVWLRRVFALMILYGGVRALL